MDSRNQSPPIFVYYLPIVVLTSLGAGCYLMGVSLNILLPILAIAYSLINFSIIVFILKKLKKLLKKNTMLKIGWLLLFSSILLWRQRAANDYSNAPVDTVAFLRIAQVSLAFIICLFNLRERAFHSLMSGLLFSMLLYCIIGVFSGGYSSHPYYATYKALESTVDVLMVAAILGSCRKFEDIKSYVSISVVFFGILLITVCIGAFLWPSEAFQNKRNLLGIILFGVSPIMNPNAVGFAAGLVCTMTICKSITIKNMHEKLLYQNVFLLSFVVLILAQARTSIVGFILAILAWLVLNKKIKWIAVVLIIAFVLSADIAAKEILVDYMRRGSSNELLYSMTGRTKAWALAWKMFKESPILGYGFASGVRFDALGDSGMVGMHGSFFDVLVNVGVLGTFFWLVAVLGTWFQLLRVFFKYSNKMVQNVKTFHTLVISFMVLLSLRAFTGTVIAMHDKEFLLLLIIMGYTLQSARTKGFTLEGSLD